MVHHSYHYQGVTDLSVFRDDAEKRAADTRSPEDTIIHLHPYDENGENCVNTQHYEYKAGKGLVT